VGHRENGEIARDPGTRHDDLRSCASVPPRPPLRWLSGGSSSAAEYSTDTAASLFAACRRMPSKLSAPYWSARSAWACQRPVHPLFRTALRLSQRVLGSGGRCHGI